MAPIIIRKPKASRRYRPKSGSELPKPVSPFNRVLNGLLLVVPVLWVLLPRAAYRPTAYASWVILVSLAGYIDLESLLLPVLLAGVLASTHHSTVAFNMALALSSSPNGSILATAWIWYVERDYITAPASCQLLYQAIITLAGDSFPPGEAALLSIGVINVFMMAPDSADWRLLLVCGSIALIPCYPFLLVHTRQFRRSKGKELSLWSVIATYLAYFGTAGTLYFRYCRTVQETFNLLVSNWNLIAYWGGILAVAGLFVFFVGPKTTLDTRRKIWHLCCVALFLPTADLPFTPTALAVALVLFLVLEVVRATALPPFGLPIHRMLQIFVDERDTRGPVTVSHIYLLIGISGPIFTSGSPAGVLSLGIGDTAASQIGKRFGRIRCFGDKTLEGTIAFALSVSASLYFFLEYDLRRAIVVGFLSSLFEAVCNFNDNLAVPLYMLFLCSV